MAKPKGNMFSAAVQQREQEQQQIEDAVTGTSGKPGGLTAGGKVKKRGENATTMTLSCSMEDKVKIKEYAARHSMSVSDLLHRWIEDNCTD